jgi:molecular chaperone IbpA
MTSNLLFPQWEQFHKSLDPFTVGFDDVFSQLQDVSKTITKGVQNHYPPYNIKQVKDNKFVIEMAVAGFAKADIEVTLDGNKLIIKGETKDSEPEDNFIFKGIANRNFIRQFTLADKIEIKDAEIANGMLKVWLENIVKAQDAVKKITVKEKSE